MSWAIRTFRATSDIFKRPVPTTHYLERQKYSVVLPLHERILGPSPWKGSRHGIVRQLLVGLSVVILCGSIASVFYSRSASARERAFDSSLVAMRSGEYTNARLTLKRITQQDPSNALAFYELGNAAYMLGDDAEASQSWAEAFRLDPSMDQAYLARGILYFNKGDIAASLRDFEEAVLLRPSAQSYLQRGLAQQALGRHGLALIDFDRATTIANSSETNTIQQARRVSLEVLAKVSSRQSVP